MRVIIRPQEEIQGEVRAPPSKSYTHRAYFLALLGEGPEDVEHCLKLQGFPHRHYRL
uniref:hypothetical protein n=1 Tax=Thermococcus pacificus TaxID=71998 RepID=UPI001E3F891D|nr:hypothetical protein [Thermococcus pacificus]